MVLKSWVPDMVLGIDFGMTCTGVAYSWGPHWERPDTIRNWPGKAIHELANKVPTQLLYDESGQGRPLKWGFLIKPEEDLGRHEEFFKLNLDPQYAETAQNQISVHEARRWFKDYMQCIYEHISRFLSDTFSNWRRQKIEFLFSVPTTWKDPAMIRKMEELVRQAGFGGDSRDHCVEIFLTEAEAAAVFAAKHSYQKNDVILVCDAGGGTTDVNLLKLKSAPGEPANITQLGFVEGNAIGSTQINISFQKLIADRLNLIQNLLPEPARQVAEKMTYGRFDAFKCNFEGDSSEPELHITIPGLRPGFNYADLRVEDSKMVLTRHELQQRFDQQIERMFRLIDGQILLLEKKFPGEKLAFIVMSGGFGSSPYLRSRLRARYEDNPTTNGLGVEGIKVNLTSQPQLSVVHGLILTRIQQLKYQEEVFRQRCCRASYGILIQEVYNPAKHVGEESWLDPLTKTTYARNQIDWLIKQGEPVFDSSIKKRYQKRLKPGEETAPFKVSVVLCDNPADRLPISIKNGEAKVICAIDTELSRSDMKLKNRRWYQFGPKYYRADFMMNLILRVLDLRFQLLSKDGSTCSREHDEIAVEWGAPGNDLNSKVWEGQTGEMGQLYQA